jgi:hypothetical protein
MAETEAELFAKHRELDQELAEKTRDYKVEKARIEAEKAAIDKQLAAFKKGSARLSEAVKAIQARENEKRMIAAKQREAMLEQLGVTNSAPVSQMDAVLAAKPKNKRQPRKAVEPVKVNDGG